MIKRFQIFLGPRRFRAFVALLALTGLASLMLNAIDSDWALAGQTLLLFVFLIGAGWLILGRLPAEERKRWLAVIAPSALAVLLGSLFLPHLTGIFVGAGLGWIVAGLFIFRSSGGPRNYQTAVKAMRKGDYSAAIAAMSAQISEQPSRPEHYLFRAELHRLAGNLKAARRDYQRMTELDGKSAVAYNGLAEVELQAKRYPAARAAAQRAQALAPEEWVAAYNLGMIEDRLADNQAAIAQLQRALALKMPDSRHRLLTHLYLWRAYTRLADEKAAGAALAALKKEKAGLEEWQVIMSADEAQALRAVLSADIDLAQRLVDGALPERGALIQEAVGE